MKYLVTAFIVFAVGSSTTSFSTNDQNKLKTGFYYLAETESQGEIILDADSEDRFAVNPNEILAASDFSAVKVAQRNFKPEPRKVIELKLTKDGRRKWAEIQRRMSATGESIVFVCNDKIYLEKRFFGKVKLDNSKIDLLIDAKYQETIFQIIQFEIKKTGNHPSEFDN